MRLNPRQQGWLDTQSPFALHLSGSTHGEISLLTQAQGKQLVGDTPRRSCLFSSGRSWYAWLSHPTTEHIGCPQCPGAGGRVGPSSSLRLCFLIREGKTEPQGHSKACPQTPGFLSLAASSLVLS